MYKMNSTPSKKPSSLGFWAICPVKQEPQANRPGPKPKPGGPRFACDKCNCTYSYKYSLKRHWASKHQTSEKEDIPLRQLLEKLVKVKREQVPLKIKLERVKSLERPSRVGDGEVTGLKPKANTCPACSKSFQEYADLLSHAIRCKEYGKHAKAEQKKMVLEGQAWGQRHFTCAACQRVFSVAPLFAAHLKEEHNRDFYIHMCEDYSCRSTLHLTSS